MIDTLRKLQARSYDPYTYWDELVSGDMDLARVGHPEMGVYNLVAYRFRLAAFLKAVEQSMPRWPHAHVFEAGFGVGFYLRYYSQIGVSQVTAMDLSAAAVSHARKLFPQYVLFQHDLGEPLALPQGTFDLVSAIDVLYHIIDDERWRVALNNLCGLVKPGGVLMLTDKFPAHESICHFAVMRRPLDLYTSVLQEHGMAVERVFPVFVLMDDPLPTARPRWLAQLSFAQWRIVNKTARGLGAWPRLRDMYALIAASVQYPFEKLALAHLSRTPNLELLVARKGVSDTA